MKHGKVVAGLCLWLLVPAGEAGAEEPSIDLGVRGGLMTVPSFFVPLGAVGGVEAQVRLSPVVRVGVYGQRFGATSTSTDHKDYEAQEFSAWRFGARVEAHARPLHTLDPWAGAGLGLFVAGDRRTIFATQRIGGWGPDLSLEAGLDIRLGEHIALGGLFSLVVPLANTKAVGGTWYSAISVVPAPLVRLIASF
jgi:hypothetical protein